MDNSTLPYFPPIRSQGSQGSCTAWASCYYYDTYTQAFDEGYTVSGGDNNHILSPAFMYPLINDGMDWGAYTAFAMARLNDIGCSSWALKPYSSGDSTSWPSEAAWVNALNNRTETAHFIDASTSAGLTAVKQHLANGNLAVTDFPVYAAWYDSYPTEVTGVNNGVYYAPAGGMIGGHAVALVGYDDNKSYVDHRDGQTHNGAFLVANSWGEWWGVTNTAAKGGFFWVAYSMFAELEFGPDVYYNDDREDYRPQLYAVVGINHAERWDVRLRGSVGGESGWHSQDVIYYDGGDIPVGDANRIAIDLTDGISHLAEGGNQISADAYVWSGSSYTATVTSADFFVDLEGDGSYLQHSSADPTFTVAQGEWGYADVALGHNLSVTVADPDPASVDGRGIAALSATYSDNQGHGIASWEWNDGGAGGLFAPSSYVQNPSYTAPANDGYQDVIVTLTVTATCDGDDALVASDSTTLTVLASRVRFSDIGTTANVPSAIGAAWGDYDDDGYPDLYIGGLWGVHRAYLLHNNGDGSFTDVTVAMGLRTASDDWEDWGPAWGDYDNDGDLDLVVAGGNHLPFLYRNDGDHFTDIGGAAAGFSSQWYTGRGAAWGDYDGDNWLDLYVTNDYWGAPSFLYQNNRDGTFTEVTSAAGMDLAPATYGQDCAWADYNNDGLLDLIVSRNQEATGDQQAARLYLNDGDGTFTDMGVAAGLPASSLEGVAWGDYDNDGWLDVYLAGNQNRATLLCHSDGDGSFTNVYDDVVDMGAGGTGVAWGDYDNDGFLDLAQGVGTLPQYNESGPSDPVLYHNNGDGTFNQVAPSVGVTARRRYRAVSWADFNLDGHLDLLMTGEDGYSCLYENAGPSTDGNWLRVRTLTSATGDATDGSPVRDALGARVEVNLDNDSTFPPHRTLMRTIDGGSGFMSQNEQIAQFGLGPAETVAVRVRFPDGSIVVETDVSANQQITIDDVASEFGTVAGVVTELISGDPAGGVTVSCDGLCAFTDYDGSFVIEGVPAGPARVVLARSATYALRAVAGISVSAEVITPVDVGLCPVGFGAIGGTVTDAATSDPIAGATVSCGTPNTTAADGTYLFYVPTGEGYTVSVSAAGYATQKQLNVTIQEGQLAQFDFALDQMAFGSVAGMVSSAATGQPIANARVRACYISDPDTQVEACYETVAAGDGTYLFDVLSAVDEYTITASASGYYSRSYADITLTADAITEVDIGLTAEFGDIPQGFWAFDQVGACVAAGIVAGYDDGMYHPGNPVSRDQMAAYIARAIACGDDNVPAYTGTPTFPDVASDHWALRYVQYAVAHEVVGGYDDGSYHPSDPVDRGQMAVFIARAMAGGDGNVPAYTGSPSFPDVDSGFWAYKYIQYIADDKRNVTQGYPDGLYHPETVVSRDQMAVYVARAFALLD